MNTADRQLYEQIISPGDECGELTFVKVTRDGSLLLGLPMRKDLAIATLGLYQPQKWKGRCLRAMMHAAILLGLYRYFPKFRVKIGDKGLLKNSLENGGGVELGFLLSGADSSQRNLIGVLDLDGELRVIKAGCGSSAEVIRREYQSMNSYAGIVPGTPECNVIFEINDGAAYMAELVKGSSPRGSADDVLVFDLLFEWLQDGKKMRLSEVVCWNELIDALDDNSQRRFEKLAGIEITSPVMHGDFAPWNIKIFKNGSVKVLDWEYAAHHGIPGWDALHYVVQRKSLVGGGAAAAILDECRVFLRSDKMKTYLERAGLENEPEALLGSYLFYSGEVQGYPRADLISQWVATQ